MAPLVVVRGRQLVASEAAVPSPVAGYRAWYKADAIVGLADDDPVAQWDDESANAFHATQATGSLQPLYKTAQVNGKPAVRFDGVDDWLHANAGGNAGDVIGGNWAVFAVVRLEAAPPATAQAAAGGSGAGANDCAFIARRADADGNWLANFDALESPTTDDGDLVLTIGAWYVLVWWEHTSSSGGADDFLRLRANGAYRLNLAEARNNLGPTTFMIGAGDFGVGEAGFLKGDIAEIIAYKSGSSTGAEEPLTLAEVVEVEDYLMTKYAIA